MLVTPPLTEEKAGAEPAQTVYPPYANQMRGPTMRQIRQFSVAFVSSVSFCVMGCAGSDQASNIEQFTSAVNLATAAVNVANIASGARAAPVSAAAVRPAGGNGTVAVPATNGYTQRKAFEECEKVYRAAGRADLAAQCAANAQNMGSLR